MPDENDTIYIVQPSEERFSAIPSDFSPETLFWSSTNVYCHDCKVKVLTDEGVLDVSTHSMDSNSHCRGILRVQMYRGVTGLVVIGELVFFLFWMQRDYGRTTLWNRKRINQRILNTVCDN